MGKVNNRNIVKSVCLQATISNIKSSEGYSANVIALFFLLCEFLMFINPVDY